MPTININSPSGMAALKAAALKAANEHYNKEGIEVECPVCGIKFIVKPDHTTCPHCNKSIVVTFE